MSKTLTKYNQIQRGTQVGQILTTTGTEFTLGLVSGTVGQVPTIQGNGSLLFQDVVASVTLDPSNLNDLTDTSGLFVDVSESTVTDTNNVVSGSTGGTTLVTLQTILDQVSTPFTLTDGVGTTANGSSINFGGDVPDGEYPELVFSGDSGLFMYGTGTNSLDISITESPSSSDISLSATVSQLIGTERYRIGNEFAGTTSNDAGIEGTVDSPIQLKTLKIVGNTAVVGQVLTLKSVTTSNEGNAEWEDAPVELPTNAATGDFIYYNGTNWVKLSEVENVQTITGTTITLPSVPVSQPKYKVYRNGTLQQEGTGNDYTISGSTITWEYALTSDLITSIYYTV